MSGFFKPAAAKMSTTSPDQTAEPLFRFPDAKCFRSGGCIIAVRENQHGRIEDLSGLLRRNTLDSRRLLRTAFERTGDSNTANNWASRLSHSRRRHP